jgi:hypothetical protein
VQDPDDRGTTTSLHSKEHANSQREKERETGRRETAKKVCYCGVAGCGCRDALLANGREPAAVRDAVCRMLQDTAGGGREIGVAAQ